MRISPIFTSVALITGAVVMSINADTNAPALFVCYADSVTQGFFKACKGGQLTTVERMITEGIDVNAKDDSGNTALHIAATSKRTLIIKRLIKAKADVNAKDAEGQTALHIVVQKGSTYCVQALIDGGADISVKNKQGDTALKIAQRKGNKKIVTLLKQAGAKE